MELDSQVGQSWLIVYTMTGLKPLPSQIRSSQLGTAQLGSSPPDHHYLHIMKTNSNSNSNNTHPPRPSHLRDESGSKHRMSDERGNAHALTGDQPNGHGPIPVRPGPHNQFGNGSSRHTSNHGGMNSFEGSRSPPGSKSLKSIAFPSYLDIG